MMSTKMRIPIPKYFKNSIMSKPKSKRLSFLISWKYNTFYYLLYYSTYSLKMQYLILNYFLNGIYMRDRAEGRLNECLRNALSTLLADVWNLNVDKLITVLNVIKRFCGVFNIFSTHMLKTDSLWNKLITLHNYLYTIKMFHNTQDNLQNAFFITVLQRF